MATTVSPDEARTSIDWIASVVPKVRDNHVDFQRTSERLLYLLQAIEEGRRTGAAPAHSLDSAMLALLHLVKRAERIIRMELQRSLGDRTWNRSEIRAELDRLRTDIDQYLGSQVVSALSKRFRAEKQSPTPAGIQEIMTVLAQLNEKENMNAACLETIPNAAHVQNETNLIPGGSAQDFTTQNFVSIGGQAKRTIDMLARFRYQMTTAKVVIKGLKLRHDGSFSSGSRPTTTDLAIPLATSGASPEINNVILELSKSAEFQHLRYVIENKGYRIPDRLEVKGECIIVKVSEATSFDPLAPEGLQISLSTPILHYFNKYIRYHNLATQPTTPGHTLATLTDDKRGVVVGGVEFQFHRTLRVPDNAPCPSNLPPSLGLFPLEPVTKFGNRVPEAMKKKGGVMMPMFEREAMWISFDSLGTRPAVKVSVGGVNALTGVTNSAPTPPNCKQEYVVAGLQPWLDGIMTASGVVRQFVGMSHGSGYTVEEQVTGKAEHGGLQFDIFPVRDMEFTVLGNKTDVFLEKTKTPAELSLVAGDELRLTFLQNLQPRHGLPSFVTHDRRDELSSYLSKAVGSIVFEASYFPRPSRATLFGDGRMSASSANWEPHLSPVEWTDSTAHVALGIRLLSQGLGLAGGGNIAQRIYEDTNHVRVYDEESGQRLFVHVVTPKEWELITGIIAPIIPISASTYKQPNVPWFQLSDDHTLALSGDANSPLSAIMSVAQLDAEKPAEPSDEIDPDHPPSCSNHSRIQSVCVFRPCSHTACSACLGAIMMLQMKCLTCEHKVERVVGMKDAIVVPTPVGDVDGLEWDVSQMEELASLAADSKNVSIIHLEEDRVPPLHASNPTAFHR